MKRSALLALGMAWLAAAFGGAWSMLSYSGAPGTTGAAPSEWPGASVISRLVGRPTLLMFVHPRCPCSRASLGELALLLAHVGSHVEARVVFIDLAAEEVNWAQTDLWNSAKRIPGVTVVRDAGGAEARVFGCETSGDTLLYDRDGRLLFHGGITMARGHSGDNGGRSALESLLQRGTGLAAAPVFGCALSGTNREREICRR